MRFTSRPEKRRVTQTMTDLFETLKNHTDKATKQDMDIALAILNDTKVEGENYEN